MITDQQSEDKYKMHVYIAGQEQPITICCASFSFKGDANIGGTFSARKNGADSDFILIPANSFLGYVVLSQLP